MCNVSLSHAILMGFFVPASGDEIASFPKEPKGGKQQSDFSFIIYRNGVLSYSFSA